MRDRDPISGKMHKTGKWRAQVTIDGKRISQVAKTQRDATEWVKKMTNQVAQGLTFAATQKNIKTFLTEWLAIKETIFDLRHLNPILAWLGCT